MAAVPAVGAAPSSYQRIWDADQAHRGVPAIPVSARGDRELGYVRVDERGQGPEHRLFTEVHIPARKRATYDLCRALFDNYRLDQTKPEDNTPAEAREILALLDAITDSAPMAEAQAQVGQITGRSYGRDEWQEVIFRLWFRQFDDGRNRHLSGFEHVVVGEQKGGKVSGYHFWYKYYLDDWPIFLNSDDIDFVGLRYDGAQGRAGRLTTLGTRVPEIATLAFRWDAYDFATGERRPLHKPVGGFWIGCSVEGLMALGTLRFFQRGPIETVINGAQYRIELYRSPDRQSLRTCFPRLIGPI